MTELTIERAKELLAISSYLKSRLNRKLSDDSNFAFDFLSPEKDRLIHLAGSISALAKEIKRIPTNPPMYFLKITLKENHTVESLIVRFNELLKIAKSCGVDEIDEIGG